MKKRSIWIVLLLITIAILIVLILTQTKHEQAATVRLVYKQNSNYLIYFVAEEKGYFNEAGIHIDPKIIESSNLMVQALGTGQADFNPSNSVPSLYSAELASPGTFKILYFMLMTKGRSNDAVLVSKDSPYKSLSDLKGKKIGGPPGIATVILLKLILRNFLDPEKDIQIIELEPQLQLQALQAKQIDAVFGLEPIITFGREKGITRVLVNEPMEQFIMNPLPIACGVVSSSFAESNPELITRLNKAMGKAIDFIRSNNSESRKILAKYIGLKQSTADNLGITAYWKHNEIDTTYVQKLANIFLQERVLDKPLQTSSLILRQK